MIGVVNANEPFRTTKEDYDQRVCAANDEQSRTIRGCVGEHGNSVGICLIRAPLPWSSLSDSFLVECGAVVLQQPIIQILESAFRTNGENQMGSKATRMLHSTPNIFFYWLSKICVKLLCFAEISWLHFSWKRGLRFKVCQFFAIFMIIMVVMITLMMMMMMMTMDTEQIKSSFKWCTPIYIESNQLQPNKSNWFAKLIDLNTNEWKTDPPINEQKTLFFSPNQFSQSTFHACRYLV